MANPFLGTTLASRGIITANYHGLAHPSQPNYIGAIAGELCGVNSNVNYELPQWTVVDAFREAGISWKAYMEGNPSPCFTGVSDSLYWRKHNPFISFPSIRATSCNNIVSSLQLSIDEATGNIPSFMWLTPDQNNDGHDTGITYSSTYLSRFLPPVSPIPSTIAPSSSSPTMNPKTPFREPRITLFMGFLRDRASRRLSGGPGILRGIRITRS
ncbi:hypothetical protein BC829DRAFT_459304 [Chytridium lagenaria]|nr:hypothetical protein BC829DRAFT_459304 [Chytridium lagenaria]